MPAPSITSSKPPLDRAALAAVMAAHTTSTPSPIDYREELDSLLSRLVPPVAARAKASVATAATVPPIPYGSYRFDVLTAMRDRRSVVVGMRPQGLYELLEQLSFYREGDTGLPLPYGVIRPWWCLLNVRLNELAMDCPAFRPNRRPAKREAGYSGDDTLLTNDRQMIDLHWLWHSGAPVTPKPKHRKLFDAETFDWQMAARLTGFLGSVANKLEDLRLNEDDQLPLMALRCDAVRLRQVDLMKRGEELEAVLRRVAGRTASRLDPHQIPDWIKDYIALRLAEGSPTEAVDVRTRLYGESFDVRHLTNRKRDLIKLGFRVREGRSTRG